MSRPDVAMTSSYLQRVRGLKPVFDRMRLTILILSSERLRSLAHYVLCL